MSPRFACPKRDDFAKPPAHRALCEHPKTASEAIGNASPRKAEARMGLCFVDNMHSTIRAAYMGFTLITGDMTKAYANDVAYWPLTNPSIEVTIGLARRQGAESPVNEATRADASS